jgi:hypothetical protein
MEERRVYKRVRFAEPVQFQHKDPAVFGGCLGADISEDGIRIYISDFIPLHSELTLQVPLGSKEVINCPAKVMWVEKHPSFDRYSVGLQFMGENYRADNREMVRMLVGLT